MKTSRLSSTAFACALSVALLAQVPQAITYQAVLRHPASGLPLSATAATGRYTLRSGVPVGAVVYEETQAITTNDQGLFTAQIGRGAPVSGSFSSVDWSNGPYFLEVSLDIGNTGSFITMGTQELLSVPYALRAGKSSNVPDGTQVGQIMHWDGSTWLADSGLYVNQRRFGIGVQQPDAPLSITSDAQQRTASIKLKGNLPSLSEVNYVIGGAGPGDTGLSFGEETATGLESRLTIAPTTGHIGIGSDEPEAPLTIKSRSILKVKFENGDIPNEEEFALATDSLGFAIDQGTASSLTSRLFIDKSTGNVGIGTTTPVERFRVHAVHHGSSVGMRVSNGAVSSNGGWTLGHLDDEAIPERSGAFALMEEPGSGGGAGGSRMVVIPGGNVGVNETMPHTTLHVTRPVSDPNAAVSLTDNTGIVMIGPVEEHLVMDSHSIQARHLLAGTTSVVGSAGSLHLQRLGGDLLIHGDATDASRMFTIKDDGKVGVGTTDPMERLHVNGAIVLGNSSSTTPAAGTIRFTGTEFQGRTASGDWAIFDGSLWGKVDNTDMIHYSSGTDPRVGIGTTSPVTRLHVTRDPADPSSLVSLQENTGVVVVGPISDNIAMDHQGIQARHLFAGATSVVGTSGLHLQRLGGDLLIHGDAVAAHQVTVTDDARIGVGKAPVERLDVDGAITLGNSSTPAPAAGTIRWNGTDFEGRRAGEWVPFDAGWRRVVSSNDIHHNARVGIGVQAPTSPLHVQANEDLPDGSTAAFVNNISSMTNLLDDRYLLGLRIATTGSGGGGGGGGAGGSSKNIGLYVSEVSGQSSAENNIAAVLNGNTVIGGLVPASSVIGSGGTNVLAIQNGSAPSSIPGSTSNSGIQIFSDAIPGSGSSFHLMNGNGDVIKLFRGSALTTPDLEPIGPGIDPSTAALIENMRTRINELENVLKNLGLLTP